MIHRLRLRLGDWLWQPQELAADNLGLFRIVYSSFYLWHLSYVRAGLLAWAPSQNWHPTYLFGVLLGRPPVWLPGFAEAILAGLLVLLLAGVCTRTVTLLILAVGFPLDGFLQSLGKVEHATIFLTFYLPLIMSFSTWGDAYSFDSLRRAGAPRSTETGIEPSGRHHTWPIKLVLLLLSFLFLTAGLSKLLVGYWMSDPDIISNLIARAYYRSIVDGLAPNLFADALLASEAADAVLRIAIPVFECLFALVLLGPAVRRFYIALTIVFHASNAVFLGVTFTPVLIAYGIAVDWKRLLVKLRDRLFVVRPPGFRWITPKRFFFTTVILAFVIAVDWNLTGSTRQIVSFGGAINWLTVWYVVGPVALAFVLITVLRFPSAARAAWLAE